MSSNGVYLALVVLGRLCSWPRRIGHSANRSILVVSKCPRPNGLLRPYLAEAKKERKNLNCFESFELILSLFDYIQMCVCVSTRRIPCIGILHSFRKYLTRPCVGSLFLRRNSIHNVVYLPTSMDLASFFKIDMIQDQSVSNLYLTVCLCSH